MEMPDSRTFESYLQGTLNKLERLNRATRAYHTIKRSTYDFNSLKEEDGKVRTVIVMMDINKRQAQEAAFRTVRWGLTHTIKSHPNRDKKVILVADEFTNLPWEGRDVNDLATFGRGFGLIQVYIFQNYAAVEDRFSKATSDVLKSEAEVVLMLPHQKNADTLSYWQNMLGSSSYISKNNSGTRDEFGVKGFSYQEQGKAVLDFDQLRRNNKGLLMVRDNRILPVELPFYWEIDPYKHMVGQSPSHKTTPRSRTKLRIRKMPLLLRLFSLLKGGRA